MRRPALSATRGIEIIDFLGSFPERSFTMSQIARAITVNVASCHAILTELTEHGYLIRNASLKTYSLGPTLVAIGNAALRNQPLIAHAQIEAEALNREFEIPVFLTRAIGTEIIGVFAIAGPKGSANVLPGFRLPLAPPVGSPFVAWASEARIASWIAQRPDANDATIDEWRRTLAVVRERGYQVLLHSPESRYFPKVLSEFAESRDVVSYKSKVNALYGSPDHSLYHADEILAEKLYDVMLIAAPIFDTRNDAVYNLCIGNIRERIPGDTIAAYANRLMDGCVRIMREV